MTDAALSSNINPDEHDPVAIAQHIHVYRNTFRQRAIGLPLSFHQTLVPRLLSLGRAFRALAASGFRHLLQ